MTDLRILPDIGPRLAADLNAVGIPDAEALRDLGVDVAARRLADAGLRERAHASRDLAAALAGVRWTTDRRD